MYLKKTFLSSMEYSSQGKNVTTVHRTKKSFWFCLARKRSCLLYSNNMNPVIIPTEKYPVEG
jgi:hypothetical protein